MSRPGSKYSKRSWTTEQDARLIWMLALHNNDFELVASELRTEFKEKVTVKDCVLQRFALLFNELYNPPYLEFLPTAPLFEKPSEGQLKAFWREAGIDNELIELMLLHKEESGRGDAIAETLLLRHPDLSGITRYACHWRARKLSYIFMKQGNTRWESLRHDHLIKDALEEELKHNGLICFDQTIDQFILEFGSQHSPGSDEVKWKEALASHPTNLKAKQCAGRYIVLDFMRRHFDTHPDRDPTLLREVRLAYHSNLSNPHLNLTLPEDKWLEIGAKVQLPLLKTRRLVQARVLWLIGHQPAFDDPTIARDELLASVIAYQRASLQASSASLPQTATSSTPPMRSAPVPTSGSGVSLEEGEEGMYSDNFSHRATTLSASSNFATATSNDHETPSRSTSSKLPLVTVLSFASTAVLPSTTSIAPTQPFAGSDPQAPFIPSPLATSANATTPTSLPPAQSFDTTTHSSSSTTFGPAPSIDRPPPFASSVTPHPAQQAIAPDTSTTNDSSDVIIPKPTLIDVMRALRGLAKGAEL